MSATQFYRIFRAVAEESGLPVQKQYPHVLSLENGVEVSFTETDQRILLEYGYEPK